MAEVVPENSDIVQAGEGTRPPVWRAITAPVIRERFSLLLLLVGTAVAYLWNLSINGWANSFYSAAIQAGSQSWKAWFFGSSDMANSITVDKPPASLWIPSLSVRVFGLNSWSILVPEALMGVASVALVYVITRRYFGHWAGILAGLVLAVTPVAAMMFRFNNPEALLILLMVASVWALLRGVEDGRWRWLILTGVLVGFGFLTKQLQVMLVVPPLAITYLAFGPGTVLRRLGQLVVALGALIVSAGWWILAVELWPASSRPYIGGSQNNSILELTLGYNGIGRLNGEEHGSVHPGGGYGSGSGFGGGFGPGGAYGGPGGPGGRGGVWGETGWDRMFTPAQGGQIAWLIPTAIILGVVALVIVARVGRGENGRDEDDNRKPRLAFLTVWGLWLIVTVGVFSYMAGIFHSYYTAALAPAVAALVGGGAAVCWRAREQFWVRAVLAVAVGTAAIWGFVLLGRTPDFVSWLRWVVLVVGLVAGLVLLLPDSSRRLRMIVAGAGVAAVVAGMAGPAAYAIDTIGSPVSGGVPSAGPRVEGGFGPPGGPGRRLGFGHRPGFGNGQGHMQGFGHGRGPMGSPADGPPSPAPDPGVRHRRGDSAGPGALPGPGGRSGPAGPGGGFGGYRGFGGPGGLLDGSRPGPQILALLRADANRYTWVAAAIGSNSASGYQLESGHSVMPIGGFNGTDPSPTPEQFQKMVADGKIHYFIAGGRFGGGFFGGGPGGGQGERTSEKISTWVTEHFTSQTVDGVTLYDLTAPVASAGGT